MDSPHLITPPNAVLRTMRSTQWVWAIVFIALAGPLNLAGLVLGWPRPNRAFLNDMSLLVFAVLMPCCVIALVMLGRMWRARTFTFDSLVSWAGAGFLYAVFCGPLGVAFASVHSGQSELSDVIGLFLLYLVYGTLLGVVPVFAIFVGLPCAAMAVAMAYACTRPVDPRDEDPLPKSAKPM